ncbi:MAG: radical SAM protein [Desulfatitalea sp.]|nr:radical SAM protein [Desulfatitalea sp.]
MEILSRDNDKGFKLLIVLPKGQAHKLEFGPVNMSFREAPLTATTLAALVPQDLNADVKIVDESVSKIPFHIKFDLVGISVLTGTAKRAYEVADTFRKNGVAVVLGGVHVKLLPDEAMKHADAIVVGFAERTWPRLLSDFANNQMGGVYEDQLPLKPGMPIPRRDLQKRFGYTMPNTVFATRGCRGRCDFCSVVAANFGWHKRAVDEVIDEIRQIKSKRIAFNDVHLTDDPEYAKELLKALIPLKKKWGGLASTKVAMDDELLELLQKSGCGYLLLGFETFNRKSLSNINKGFNKLKEYKNVIKKIHDKKIIIQGCFIFGIDGEDKSIFKNTVDYIQELKIDIPRYAVFTPYPGTGALADSRLFIINNEPES